LRGKKHIKRERNASFQARGRETFFIYGVVFQERGRKIHDKGRRPQCEIRIGHGPVHRMKIIPDAAFTRGLEPASEAAHTGVDVKLAQADKGDQVPAVCPTVPVQKNDFHISVLAE
jgi:hypothetical protein